MYGNIPALKDNVEFKNIALSAAGGRSSVSGIRATIFGAGSRALGHQIVFRLGKKIEFHVFCRARKEKLENFS